MRSKIEAMFNEMWREDNQNDPPTLRDETVLLETGFDSMAFAVLVARLDDELGIDPFSVATDAAYPRTFGEFVAFYENCPKACAA
jgi:acyl carrier protein